MKLCSKCGETKDLSRFSPDRQTKRGVNCFCKVCRAAMRRADYARNPAKSNKQSVEWRKKNADHVRKYNSEWRLKNTQKARSLCLDWREKNKGAVQAYNKAYASNNQAALNARWARRYAQKKKAAPPWANQFFIEEIYDLAVRRAFIAGIEMEVDHIVPLVSRLVCGLHVEGNLRVITAKANRKKSNKWWPDMPLELAA